MVVEELAKQHNHATVASLLSLTANQLHTMLAACYRKYAKDPKVVMPTRLVDLIMKIPSTSLTARIRSLPSHAVDDETVATNPVGAGEWKECGSDTHELCFPVKDHCEVEVQVKTLRTVSTGGGNNNNGKNEISWWVMLFASNQSRTDRELLSIRKIALSSYANTTTTVKLIFPTPIVPSQLYLDVEMINDMYIGIQQSISMGKLITK